MRTKLGLLGLCAMVVGIMSMSASAAQGATLSWLILNAAGTTATNLKAELKGQKDTEHLELTGVVAGLPVVVTCTNFSLNAIFIEPEEKASGGKVVFTGCKAYKEKLLVGLYECTVKSVGATENGKIETEPEAKGLLELIEGSILLKVEPAGGPTGNFAKIKFEGASCPLTELNVVHGVVDFKDCEGFATTHKVKHLVEANETQTKLYIGGHSATQLEKTKLLGSVWIELGAPHAGLAWSAMDV